MDDQLYEVNDIYLQSYLTSTIRKAGDSEILYKVSFPKGIKFDGRGRDLTIDNIYMIDNTYIYISCGSFVLLLDKEFELVLWHEGNTADDWCMIKDNKYYYLNSFGEVIVIDMNTKEQTAFEIYDFAHYIDCDGEYFYFTNDSKILCKASGDTGENTVLYKGVTDFLLGSEYIYLVPTSYNEQTFDEAIIVLDKEGNVVNKIDNKIGAMGFKYHPDNIREVNDKIIVTCNDTVLMFELDGSNPKEYAIEQ